MGLCAEFMYWNNDKDTTKRKIVFDRDWKALSDEERKNWDSTSRRWKHRVEDTRMYYHAVMTFVEAVSMAKGTVPIMIFSDELSRESYLSMVRRVVGPDAENLGRGPEFDVVIWNDAHLVHLESIDSQAQSIGSCMTGYAYMDLKAHITHVIERCKTDIERSRHQ